MIDIVLDTNCLIASISRRGAYFDVWRGLRQGRFRMCVSNEILDEYEEIISRLASSRVAANVIQTLINSPHVRHITPYFRFHLIESDKDDNKFVDCAIAASADYIVSEDAHFKALRANEFPYVSVIRLKQFLDILSRETVS